MTFDYSKLSPHGLSLWKTNILYNLKKLCHYSYSLILSTLRCISNYSFHSDMHILMTNPTFISYHSLSLYLCIVTEMFIVIRVDSCGQIVLVIVVIAVAHCITYWLSYRKLNWLLLYKGFWVFSKKSECFILNIIYLLSWGFSFYYNMT